jgi:hypothetical protein
MLMIGTALNYQVVEIIDCWEQALLHQEVRIEAGERLSHLHIFRYIEDTLCYGNELVN